MFLWKSLFYIVLVHLGFGFVLHKQGFSVAFYVQPEETPKDGDYTYCSSTYPYTYSKCLSICSPITDVSCLDDQLCYCSASYEVYGGQYYNLLIMEMNRKFGAHPEADCKFSHLCNQLCQEDETMRNMVPDRHAEVSGVLCRILRFEDEPRYNEYVESCVCGK